jgi:hypothetical protein
MPDPRFSDCAPGGTRIQSLLTYRAHQQVAILRASALDTVLRQQVAPAAAAQANLPYDDSAIGHAVRHYARRSAAIPAGWLDLVKREAQPNGVNEALPTANTGL